ncbi:hypothetical protein NC652_020650 [Populus alba x Populus x berolinensis]|nr:hypothetical protein NC652_020650 [Populus alba x Populus x berolinensis]
MVLLVLWGMLHKGRFWKLQGLVACDEGVKHVFVQRREQATPSTNSPTVWTAIAYASNLEDQHRFSLRRSYHKCWNQHHLQKSETHLLKCKCGSALQGESLAVREAVGLAIARRWDRVDFETDSSNVANAVSSHMVNATWEIYPNR